MKISVENLDEMIKQAKSILSTVKDIIKETIDEKIWCVLEKYGFNRYGTYEGIKSEEEKDLILDKIKTEVEKIYYDYEGFYRTIIEDCVRLDYWVEETCDDLTFYIHIMDIDEEVLYEFTESFYLEENNDITG